MRYHIKLKSYGDNYRTIVDIAPEYQSKLGLSQVELNTDKYGFITFPNFIEKENKIFLIGDSFIECKYLPPGRRLSDILNTHAIDTNNCFFNAGMSGSTILNSYNLFINKIVPLDPAIIIISPGLMSSSTNYVNGNFFNNYVHRSHLTDMCEPLPAENNGDDNFDTFVNILLLFVSAANIFSTKLLFLNSPYRYPANNPQINRMNEVIDNFCSKHGLQFLDLQAHISQSTAFFYDYSHLNFTGSLYFARLIYHWIESSP